MMVWKFPTDTSMIFSWNGMWVGTNVLSLKFVLSPSKADLPNPNNFPFFNKIYEWHPLLTTYEINCRRLVKYP